jgi:hypothetical protein
MDLFVVPTISFGLLYGLLIVGHGRRHILWFGVTAHPTAEWIANQVTEACGWEQAPRYLIRDRDGAYGEVSTSYTAFPGARTSSSLRPISNSRRTLKSGTVVGLVRKGANVAVFRTFSKIYGLASLAIGYVLAPQELASDLKQIGIGAFFDLNWLSLVAARASLEDADYVTTVRTKVKAERDAWHELFRERRIRYANS